VFPGWLDEVQLQTLMERADIGLAPYHRSENVWGAIPNKIGQYLSAGLPVLSTLVGGLDKLLARYGCGWTYEPMNVNELVGLVREIIRQKDRLPEMRERAKKLFADYFDAEKIYPAYVNYIEEVAQKFRVKRLAA
jgi:glycosyltransferase involved in cell wall biosynthesis